MAQPTLEIIQTLRQTAARLEAGAAYYWSHHGSCNCGHLAQSITRLSRQELHQMALQKAGDWSEHLIDYCPASGYPIDHVIDTMLAMGFSREDLIHLERLSDPRILARLPLGERSLEYNKRDDVVRYLYTWAAWLEERLYGDTVPTANGLPQTQPTAAVPVLS